MIPFCYEGVHCTLASEMSLQKKEKTEVSNCREAAYLNNEIVPLQNNEYKEFQHEIGRCRDQAIRISGVLATAAGSKTITKKIAEDAVEISHWCLGQMLMILAGREMVTFEADKKELKRIINEKKKDDGWATVRDVKKGKKAFTDDRLEELCAKYPETFA